jgi:hypothetical protein
MPVLLKAIGHLWPVASLLAGYLVGFPGRLLAAPGELGKLKGRHWHRKLGLSEALHLPRIKSLPGRIIYE